MMCHRIGRSPISTMGLGLAAVSSDRRVPSPPARITTFTTLPLPAITNHGRWLQCTRRRSFSRVVVRDQRVQVLRHHHQQYADHEELLQVSPCEGDAVY